MNWEHTEPRPWPAAPGIAVLQARPGRERDAIVARWLADAPRDARPPWHLSCDPAGGGAWAGLSRLISALVPRVGERAPELLARHGRELCLVAPELEAQIGFVECLTDIAEGEEKTRNYPADRAYRCLHGLVEFLSAWHEMEGAGTWSMACDDFDRANGLVRRFFSELWRRRGAVLGLRLLIVIEPGQWEAIASSFPAPALTGVSLETAPDPDGPSPQEMTRRALELEGALESGEARDAELTQLIDAWRRSSTPERALRWEVIATSRYSHAGLYEASLPYVPDIETGLDRLFAEGIDLYHAAINMLYFCHVTGGRPESARRAIQHALDRPIDDPELSRYQYLMSMLHARFLRPNDQAAAERWLEQALAVVERSDLPGHERHFQTVFLWNGLALVRLRQGRVADALALCRAGLERLNAHLPADRHQLHRSVLLFNIAQVHAQVGPYEDAVDYFTQAIDLDPNYSEYYNDRGATYFKMGRLDEAERDYRRAIELSAPYDEVWTNLGQCYRLTGRMEEAAAAYTRAIDLDPVATLALAGRAEARAALGSAEGALADYDRTLALDPDQALVLAGRAIVHYEAGRVREALADLDAAVALEPELAELYQNRAVALGDLGRSGEAVRDLERYLELCPDAEDRTEVEEALDSMYQTAR